jgi:hypothetical protein
MARGLAGSLACCLAGLKFGFAAWVPGMIAVFLPGLLDSMCTWLACWLCVLACCVCWPSRYFWAAWMAGFAGCLGFLAGWRAGLAAFAGRLVLLAGIRWVALWLC